MTRLNISIDEVEDETVAKIFALLGVGPQDSLQINGTKVAIPAPPPPLEPVGWNAETAHLFVAGLTPECHQALTMICDAGGILGLDEIIETLDLSSGKALGGVMSSVGHNLVRLANAGRLPEGEKVTVRDEANRVYRMTVSSKVRTLITNACHRRAREDAGVAAVA